MDNRILNLQPKQFKIDSSTHYGLDTYNLETFYPELIKDISENESDNVQFKAINYIELIPILIHHIQYQQSQINDLRNRVYYLETSP